jgi:hypothetical protein
VDTRIRFCGIWILVGSEDDGRAPKLDPIAIAQRMLFDPAVIYLRPIATAKVYEYPLTVTVAQLGVRSRDLGIPKKGQIIGRIPPESDGLPLQRSLSTIGQYEARHAENPMAFDLNAIGQMTRTDSSGRLRQNTAASGWMSSNSVRAWQQGNPPSPLRYS